MVSIQAQRSFSASSNQRRANRKVNVVQASSVQNFLVAMNTRTSTFIKILTAGIFVLSLSSIAIGFFLWRNIPAYATMSSVELVAHSSSKKILLPSRRNFGGTIRGSSHQKIESGPEQTDPRGSIFTFDSIKTTIKNNHVETNNNAADNAFLSIDTISGKSTIPDDIVDSLDAILVLGGGVPTAPSVPPSYVQTRCDAAAQLVLQSVARNNNNKSDVRNINKEIAIVTLSAGTAHLPQLINSSNGLPIWESTASAAYIINKYPEVSKSQIYAETTSYDTISNAYYTRTTFTDITGWRKILIVTNEFHMERTKIIFDWVFGASSSTTTGDGTNGPYQLYYLSCDNTGLSNEALEARRQHERKGSNNIKQNLIPNYPTLKDIWKFLTTNHDFYNATKLAITAFADVSKEQQHKWNTNHAALKDSYGGTGLTKQ